MIGRISLALSLLSVAALSGLAACNDDGAGSLGATASIEIPLIATGTPSGKQYSLEGRFRITGEGFNQVVEAPGDQTSIFVDVPPPMVDVELRDWVLNGPDGMPVEDEVVLLSDNPQTGIPVTEGADTIVRFEFGVGEEFITPGNGQLQIGIDVYTDVGAAGGGTGGTSGKANCPCWNGTEGVSADCGGRPCESLEDIWASLFPSTCSSEFCFDGVNTSQRLDYRAQCTSPEVLATGTSFFGDGRPPRCFVDVEPPGSAGPVILFGIDLDDAMYAICRDETRAFIAPASFVNGRAAPCNLPSPSP